ncbi:penicillin-binding protein 2 [Methylobacter sp. S3L5C]|uniref:peptidoglycan D,D-transpeptidase FtsI family protein n=1 Tax=Methylobacter sp. S3L5C TaxID=2839024 RepID=UPI001FADC4EF|nr:penicillin-binding protein 2 [Methylobacter sp. S3L5C]UOA10035.1 penicillin-binding protein 2 [Methylobacter sp. S3L5C]
MLDFRARSTTKQSTDNFSGRRKFLVIFMMVCMLLLTGRAIDLQVVSKQFLKHQGDMRQVDEVSVSAYRGMITDRNGDPLAISTPVESIWINPRELKFAKEDQLRLMEKLLHLPIGKVTEWIKEDSHRQFLYIARRVNPQLGTQVKELKLEGVYFEREFKRFYPSGGVSAHLVGFTNVDDIGQAGMESGYEQLLKGISGSKRVIRDGQRRIIADIENIQEPVSGKTLELSIDQRIQYLAYRELQLAVSANKAKSGALVVLDAKNGEVLAAVSQPSFNPNTRSNLKESLYRNRAVTDVFEPGSTVKPFVVAAALDGGYISPNAIFATHGTYQIGRNTVKDTHNYGTMDLTHVIKKSSNIGVTMMSLKMPPKYFWGIYHQLGFGVSAGSGFPGEASGTLLGYKKWHDFDRAILSFGYGLSSSTLQLARAYTALADDGILHSVSLLKREEDDDAVRIFSAKTAKSVRKMMETVIMKDGTAYEARVDGYSAAGKTGTAKKAGSRGYTEKSYFAVFAGMAPASDPRLIIVVMIDEPSAGQYYGGLVSAPVFSKVMAGALRILGVAPDQEGTMPVLLTQKSQ